MDNKLLDLLNGLEVVDGDDTATFYEVIDEGLFNCGVKSSGGEEAVLNFVRHLVSVVNFVEE